MVHEIHDTLAALKKLLECLLLSYRYDAASSMMQFVFEYPEKPVGTDRAFIRFRFEGVSEFRRIPGEFAELQRFVETYSAQSTRAATVVQKIDIDVQGRFVQITLGFGHSFGDVSFVCDRVAAEVRNTRATRVASDEWEYRDSDDCARVDFYDPFA